MLASTSACAVRSPRPFTHSARGPLCAPAVGAPRQRLVKADVAAKDFVNDCTSLGKCRFIVVGEGAILETVQPWSR